MHHVHDYYHLGLYNLIISCLLISGFSACARTFATGVMARLYELLSSLLPHNTSIVILSNNPALTILDQSCFIYCHDVQAPDTERAASGGSDKAIWSRFMDQKISPLRIPKRCAPIFLWGDAKLHPSEVAVPYKRSRGSSGRALELQVRNLNLHLFQRDMFVVFVSVSPCNLSSRIAAASQPLAPRF